MSIPSSVKVAGVEYKVKDVRGLEQEHGLWGQCLYALALIKLDDRLNEDRKEQIFCHELVHAMFNEAGFEQQDEDTVNRLGIVLYQVLKDNRLYFGEDKTSLNIPLQPHEIHRGEIVTGRVEGHKILTNATNKE